MKKKIKKWLDAIVDTEKQKKKLSVLNERISIYEPDNHVLIRSGIREIAKAMNLDLKHYVSENEKTCYPHKYQFVYRGVLFRQIEKSPLE